MRTHLITAALLLIGITHSYAQLCGQGVHSIEVYVPNGKKIKSLTYEVIPIQAPDNKHFLSLPDFYDGVIIDSVKAKEAIIYEKARLNNKSTINVLSSWLTYNDVIAKGEIKEGSLLFRTHEGVTRPCIVKITADNHDVYLIGNFFGGCSKSTIILARVIDPATMIPRPKGSVYIDFRLVLHR